MTRFKGFIIKEFYHIFRDYRSMVILFGMPVIQILLFGFAINMDIKDARIAVLDNSKDVVTQKIIQKIVSSGYFKLTENLSGTKDIEQSFKNGKLKEVIIFEPDFTKKLYKDGQANIQIIADAADPNMANLLVNYSNAIITDFQKELMKSQNIPFQIIPEVQMRYNPDMKSVFMFIPGTMTIILMLISAMMTSISIAREKEMGTMEVLLVSPLKPVQIIIGKVVPYVFLAFINAVVILLMGTFVFGLAIKGNVVLLLAESMLFVIMALSLGIFISTAANSQLTAMMVSLVGLMLPTILLSGFIFPIENMPLVLQWISNAIPAKWFIIAVKGIMLKGTGISFIWKETVILAGMTLFFLAMSIKKFKIRLE
ncbi:MAG: ABC transporter permease [Bacteroidia bacterium]|nr:ABC transporter permease [Bacteroidia bacterium]